jgi:hypothetical protein
MESTVLWVVNALWWGDRPTFRGNIPPPSSGLKSKRRNNPTETGGKSSVVSCLLLLVSYMIPQKEFLE